MKYAGMPFGMWVLFAGSFQKFSSHAQLITSFYMVITPLDEELDNKQV